ncbi:MAG: antibiotic biosynthesis monooxygenase [Bacteroidales bacterium]|nr:antibiotic biosynthesis monooxygenase [Bacteroidales bacterium]
MEKQIFKIALIVFAFVLTNVAPSFPQAMLNDKKGVILFVEFELDQKDMETALALLKEMQIQTLENEEGCIAYDILLSDEHPNKIYLYECYENAQAHKKHTNSPYYKDIVSNKLSRYLEESETIKLYPVVNEKLEGFFYEEP